MRVVHSLDWDGIFLREEVLDDAKPDLEPLIDFYVEELVRITLERKKGENK